MNIDKLHNMLVLVLVALLLDLGGVIIVAMVHENELNNMRQRVNSLEKRVDSLEEQAKSPQTCTETNLYGIQKQTTCN